jgi:hypothetical protein
LNSENAWSRESNIEIFLTSTPDSTHMSEREVELFMNLVGNAKRAHMDKNLVRFDENSNKLLLVISNIKRFLVLPR